MIGDSFDRITFLMQHKRNQEAIEELNKVIHNDPNNPILFMLLAENHYELDGLANAEKYAKQAVHLAPDLDDVHRTLARVYIKQAKTKLALTHAQEALEINPAEADNFATLGAIYLDLAKWKLALEQADRGLALEPDHLICLNIRTMALTKLGHKQAVDDTIKVALKEDPEDPVTHANWGWALLHQGKSDEAIIHFKEALRLDPSLDWARAGIVEAIKSKNIIYALILKFYMWLAKFPPRYQLLLILGLFVVEKIIRGIVASIPAIVPLADWVLGVYVGLVFMVWMSISFFNLLLRLHPEGKLALTDKQKKASTWFGYGLILVTSLTVIMSIQMGQTFNVLSLLIPLFLMFPITVAIKAKAGKSRALMIAYALINISIAGAAMLLGRANLFNISLIMSVLSTWIGNFIPKDNEMV